MLENTFSFIAPTWNVFICIGFLEAVVQRNNVEFYSESCFRVLPNATSYLYNFIWIPILNSNSYYLQR